LLELVILLSLASWRITSLLHTEAAFDWLRKLIGIDRNDSYDTHSWFYPDNFIGELFSCFWCLALAVSLVLATVTTILRHFTVWQGFILWMASGTGAIYIERHILRTKAR